MSTPGQGWEDATYGTLQTLLHKLLLCHKRGYSWCKLIEIQQRCLLGGSVEPPRVAGAVVVGQGRPRCEERGNDK